MDYYRKKFKPSRPVFTGEIDLLNEIESKWVDMQPIIHECAGDKTKVQKHLSQIRSYIEHCQRVGEKVSVEQQERIKEIIRKCKEVLEKYGNINEFNTSGLKSPQLFRKATSADASEQEVPQNKVALVEVEAKLKSMRQKRLDRLSTFVTEQSKLSEERSARNNESNEIENAIKSIQQTSLERKSSFKSITEENDRPDDINIRRHSSGLSDKSKSFSTKKFINKFNCGAAQTIGSSNEDLTKEHDNNSHFVYSKEVGSKVLDEKHDFNRSRSSLEKQKDVDGNRNNIAEKVTALDRTILQKGKEEVKENNFQPHNYNPLMSPVGKQRRAIYMYDNECKFLEHDQLATASDKNILRNFDVKPKIAIGHFYENREIIAKNENEKTSIVLTTFGKANQENFTTKPAVEPKSKAEHVYENKAIIDKNESENVQTVLTTFGKKTDEVKEETECVYENIVTKKDSDKPPSGLATFKENNPQEDFDKNNDVVTKPSLGYTNENRIVTANKLSSFNYNENNIVSSTYENVRFKPKKSNSLTKLIIRTEVAAHRKSDDNVYKPRSPLPLPRRSNNEERVLKKLQRNWDSLNQIIENDSDVDGDELEDLKKTWEEASALLGQYKAKIDKLEPSDADGVEKLSEIKTQLKDVGEAIKKFRGLKMDSSYAQLASRLSTYFLEVNKINCIKTEALNEKKMLLSEIDAYIKLLENNVNRNEAILQEILEAQVKSIGTKYLNITQV